MGGNIISRLLAAGAGLPHLYRLVYMELAATADWRTGIVGKKTRLSIRALRERTEVEPAPGRKDSGQASKEQIQRAIAYLEKQGYIVRVGNTPFVFKVPALLGDKSAQNKVAPQNTPQNTSQNTPTKPPAQPVNSGDSANSEHLTSTGKHAGNNPLNSLTSDIDKPLNREEVVINSGDQPAPAQIVEYFLHEVGLQPHQAANKQHVDIYNTWIKAGATLQLVKQVVETVNQRLIQRGGVQIASTNYYTKEITAALEQKHATHSKHNTGTSEETARGLIEGSAG